MVRQKIDIIFKNLTLSILNNLNQQFLSSPQGLSLIAECYLIFYYDILEMFSKMRRSSSGLIIIALLAFLLILSECTLLTFYIDHQVEQPLDYVEVNAVVKVNGDSLEQSIEEATATIASIEDLVDNYCKTYTPKQKQKKECGQMIEVSPYSIKPQYQIFKNKEQFGGFVVAHQIFLKVKETDEFGSFVDNILKIGVNKINSLEWKPKEEVSGEQSALEEGVKQAHDICNKIGSKLVKIITAEEVTDFGQEKEEGSDKDKQQEEDDQEQQEPLDIKDDIVYYKFVVQCQRSKLK